MIENHHMVEGEEYAVEYPDYGEGCPLQCDCASDCYQDNSSHQEYRCVAEMRRVHDRSPRDAHSLEADNRGRGCQYKCGSVPVILGAGAQA